MENMPWLVGPQRDGHASGSKPAAAEAEAAADEDRSAAISAAAAGACQWSMYVRTRMEWRVFRALFRAEADGFNAAGKANVDSKMAEAPARNKKKEQVQPSLPI